MAYGHVIGFHEAEQFLGNPRASLSFSSIEVSGRTDIPVCPGFEKWKHGQAGTPVLLCRGIQKNMTRKHRHRQPWLTATSSAFTKLSSFSVILVLLFQ